MLKYLFFLPLLPSFLFAQHPVDGQATISFVEGGSLCDGALKRVDIFVDITGLTGQGGDAGLNAFALWIDMTDSSFYVRSEAGSDPIPFELTTTEAHRIDTVGTLRLVGHNADTDAPNTSYHVASIYVGNQLGSVTLKLATTNSSLGSRKIGSSGPGPIDFVFDGPLTVTIENTFPLQISDAAAAWLSGDPTYDFQPPFGIVNVLDLVSIAECGSP